MTAMEQETPKKKASKKAVDEAIRKASMEWDAGKVAEPANSIVETFENGAIVMTEVAEPVEPVKSKVRPGHKDFDWKNEEYPDDDDVYVFTSSEGLTIGLARLGPKRKPKPGLLRRLHREGGMSVMWYFIELASSDASLKLQEELEEEDYTEMLRGWAEFAGIELSE